MSSKRNASVAALALAGLVLGPAARAAEEAHGDGGGLLGTLGIVPWLVLSQLFAFLLLLWLLKIFLWKPVLDLLDSRKTEVASIYSEADSSRDSAELMRRDYEARLAKADEESRQRISEAMQQASAMKEDIINAAREQADRIVTSGREDVRRETEKALVQIRDTVATLAVGAAGKIIHKNLDEDAHRDLVDDFIARAGHGGPQ